MLPRKLIRSYLWPPKPLLMTYTLMNSCAERLVVAIINRDINDHGPIHIKGS